MWSQATGRGFESPRRQAQAGGVPWIARGLEGEKINLVIAVARAKDCARARGEKDKPRHRIFLDFLVNSETLVNPEWTRGVTEPAPLVAIGL